MQYTTTTKTVILAPWLVIICCSLLFTPLVQAAEAEAGLTLLEAVSTGIVQAPEVSLAKEDIAYTQALVQLEKGEQDPSLTMDMSFDRLDFPLTPYMQRIYEKSAEDIKTLDSRVSAQKTLDNGIVLTQSVGLERIDDTVLDSPPDNYATVSFDVFLPVVRLWESGFAADEEKNSEIQLRASYLDLAATVSNGARTTAISFWRALAQKMILGLNRKAEAESRKLLHEVKVLVAKGQYPPASLDKNKVDVEAKAVQRISQEQAVYAARQALALEMGVETDQLQDLPAIRGEFPAINSLAAGVETMIAFAREKRPDLQAAQVRQAYYRELVDDAREEALPDVGLNLQAGYHGLRETSSGSGYAEALGSNVPGPSYSIGLTYTKSFGNNISAGILKQAKVNLRKQQIAAKRLENSMFSEILTAYQEYLNSVKTLRKQRDAITVISSALDDRYQNFRQQQTGLSDLMEVKDLYYQSRVALIARQEAYASSIILLRHACGALVEQPDSRFQVNAKSLRTPPQELNATQQHQPD